jgi:hypothetical protein
MGKISENHFSGLVTVFQDRRLPEAGVPTGYAALIHAYGLLVPLPRSLSAIGTHHKTLTAEGWRLFTPRHAPEDSLAGHLTFALKWEGLDLLVLKRLFEAVPGAEIADIVRAQPTGRYARRIWFLYEWLTARTLDLPAATAGTLTDALDTEHQFGVANAPRSPRHRVRNNLPGTPEFCPLVFRSEALTSFLAEDLGRRAQAVVAPVPADILARAAAFLLLEDSRSSFAIEGEQPAQSRVERWSQAIAQAGRAPLDLSELLRLQSLLIGDLRFVRPGLREGGSFVGQHDRRSGAPLPAHISARATDLSSLVSGLVAFATTQSRTLDPVIAAACAAFGFVFIHPFEDGNGRLHRYLIHHVLAERGFTPPGLIFPVSAVILRLIDDYRRALEASSRPLLPLIDWEPTADGNVRVLNDTADLYRFFDATPHAEFLFRCVRETIEQDLPRETAFLEAYDRFVAGVQALVDMPGPTIDLLFRFLHQNRGMLSKRARNTEFAMLTDEEVAGIEALYRTELASL